MPELPEVETIVRQLAPRLGGRRIGKVEVFHPDLLHGPAREFSRGLEGARILSVERRGKNIVLSLTGPQVLVVNLGMTGKLLFFPPGARQAPPGHLGVSFSILPAGRLHYSDVRRFGHLRRYASGEWAAESARLGPEPLGKQLSGKVLGKLLRRSRAPIRSWLLDQTKIAGVGNIYASEALFRARVHPTREARSLGPGETGALFRGIRSVLREAIRARGTTLRDYRTAAGETGGFGPSLRVYGRAGQPCPRCKVAVERIVFANRSAFFCPSCQPEETPSES